MICENFDARKFSPMTAIMKFDTAFLKYSDVCRSSDKDNMECWISTMFTAIAFSFLLLFGTFGNIASLCVLLRQKMRKLSASTFLTFLTVSDTLSIWLSSAQVLTQHFYDKNLNENSMMTCKLMPWLHFNLASFSLWCIAAFSIHRLLCLRTTIMGNSGQKKYEVTGLICLLIAICLLNSPVLFGNVLSMEKQTPVNSASDNSTNVSTASMFTSEIQNLANQPHERSQNISQATALADIEEILNDDSVEILENVSQTLGYKCVYISKEFETLMLRIWIPFCVAVYFFLPVIIIVICNLAIMFTIIKSRRTVATFQNTQLNHTKYSGTRVLVVISSYTLLTTTPLSVYGLVVSNNKSAYIQPKTYILQIGVIFLGYSNFALNGAFYLWFGTMFRREFLAMLTEAKAAIVSLHRRTRVNPE